MRAAALGWTVLAWDALGEHVRVARERGAVSAGCASFAGLLDAADIVVLATPLDATVELLRELSRAPGGIPQRCALLLDVASVKTVVARAARTLPGFVATHPIAGSQRSGPAHARADLFEGRTWTYDSAAAPQAAARAVSFIRAMGARPLAVANEEHDRTVALTSHLPQLVSVALGARLAAELDFGSVLPLCGTGMRSMVRLGASAWSVWEPVLAANAGALAEEVRRLAVILTGMAEALESGGTATLAGEFSAANTAASRLGANDEPGAAVHSKNSVHER